MKNTEVSKIIAERTGIDLEKVLNDMDIMHQDESSSVDIEQLVSGFEEAYEDIAETGSLGDYATRELVEELKQREGVKTVTAEAYQAVTVTENGPAIILVVAD